MASDLERRPGATPGTSAVGNGGAVGAPGRNSLTGALPRTTADFGPTAAPAPGVAAGPSALGLYRVTADRLNVRLEARIATDNVVGGLELGATVVPLRREGEWIRINYRGRPCYLHGGYVEPVHQAAAGGTPASPQAASLTPAAAAQPAAAAPGSTAPHADAPEAEAHAQAKPHPPASEIQPPPAPVHTAAESEHPATQPAAAPKVHEAVAPAAPVSAAATPSAPSAPAAASCSAGSASSSPTSAPTSAAPSASAPKPAAHIEAPHADAAPAASSNYLSGYTSLGGTNIATLNTSEAEAKILNAIRASDHRLDPVWLAQAQTKLSVASTGAFNTETLRALIKLHPKIDAAAITTNKDGVLTKIQAGSPFVEVPDGFGTGPREGTGATKADRAAHKLGYADYAAFHAIFLPVTFLGVALNKGQGSGLGHPHLIERLRVAETFLRGRHPEAKSDKEIVQAIGWNKSGNAAYQDDTQSGTSHFHTMGLAIDMDVQHNPYVFTGRTNIGASDSDEVKKQKQAKNWWMDLFEKHTGYAAKIFGGEKIGAAVLDHWAKTQSTDELYAHVAEISKSFAAYLALASESDDKIVQKFTAAGISADTARADLSDVHQMPHYFHDFMGRGEANTFTTHSQELLVALRDVAGLSWGGAEMSSNENGDFMHFDCRQDGFGLVLQSFNFP